MAYAQWVFIHIINSFRNGTIKVKNAQAFWQALSTPHPPSSRRSPLNRRSIQGKFYRDGNKDAEISSADVSAITIPAGATADISSCGRSDASSGTEGQLDLYEDDTKIGTIYWDCPWGSKANNFQIRDRNSDADHRRRLEPRLGRHW